MSKIMWAYIIEGICIIIAITLGFVYGDNPTGAIINKFNLIISFGITVNLLWKDAKQRGLSIAHGLWAFLGIIGVLIYHLAFAKKIPIKT